jgi:hypothetical protein
MKTSFTFLTVLFFTMGQMNLYAQDIRSVNTGFSLNIHGKYSNWTSSSFFLGDLSEEKPNGPGMGFKVAYGFSEKISIFLGYGQSSYALPDFENDRTHQQVQAGATVNFGATLKSLRPFISAGIGQHSMKIEPIIFYDDIFLEEYVLKVSGLAVEFAAGVQWFILPNLAAEFSLNSHFGRFDQTTLDGFDYDPEETLDFRFLGGQIGITYYFQ